ncbi:protein FAR1-RELATED SEQUENCE 5-like [Miscanthus floridulus]|uniref:protein FAR1-RELATED SEQUENCE 5-like n=1 Tax=Miscanthus floridulus TaxID=154761 RepID=UPI003458CCC7
MDNRGEDEHEEELDFHLGAADDSSSDDENTSSNSRLSSMGKDIGGDAQRDAPRDGNCAYDQDIFTRMAAGAEMNNTLDEYWDIVKKTFATEGEAYIFYNKYARDKGFSVRKQKVRRAKHSGQLLFWWFLCSREGKRETKWPEKEDLSRRPRPLTRCVCQAKLDIKLDRTRGVWYVSNFVDEHNHGLATKDEVPFLWSHQKLRDFQKTEIMSMEAVGIRKHVIMDVLQCRYVGYSEVGIVRKNICGKNQTSGS